jgi:hypothetical protein
VLTKIVVKVNNMMQHKGQPAAKRGAAGHAGFRPGQRSCADDTFFALVGAGANPASSGQEAVQALGRSSTNDA